jgi:hypothetical protein
LVENKETDSISGEVSDRLNDLFGDDEEEMPAVLDDVGELAVDPIQNLKAIVLSIEWEISDEMMNRFVEEIALLKMEFKEDRILVLFLQLLGSLGEYIRSNKGEAHPNSFKLINQVFEKFEAVYLADNDMSGLEKKRTLSVQLAQFKALKEQIAARKAAAKTMPDTTKKVPVEEMTPPSAPSTQDKLPAAVQAETVPERYVAQDAFQQAVEEIKEMIRFEFKTLRDELKQLLGGD